MRRQRKRWTWPDGLSPDERVRATNLNTQEQLLGPATDVLRRVLPMLHAGVAFKIEVADDFAK